QHRGFFRRQVGSIDGCGLRLRDPVTAWVSVRVVRSGTGREEQPTDAEGQRSDGATAHGPNLPYGDQGDSVPTNSSYGLVTQWSQSRVRKQKSDTEHEYLVTDCHFRIVRMFRSHPPLGRSRRMTANRPARSSGTKALWKRFWRW